MFCSRARIRAEWDRASALYRVLADRTLAAHLVECGVSGSGGDHVRWEALFADLEAQAEALAVAERAGEIVERTRAEVGSLSLIDRLRPACGGTVRVRTRGAGTIAGTLERLGPDWLLITQNEGRETLVRLGAVLAVSGPGRTAAVPGTMDPVTARLGLWFVLRKLARDRSPLLLVLADGSSVAATIDRVGADYIEVAAHAPGEWRRARSVREALLVPMAGLVAVGRDA